MASYHSEYAYGPLPPPGPQPQYLPTQPPSERYVQQSVPINGYEHSQYMYQPPPPATMQHRHAVMYGPPLKHMQHPHQYLPPPRRAYTPGYDGTPPSSGPNSSAPHSSNPSTPQDPNNTGNVTIDPNFIDPTLSELYDDSSEQAVFSSYIAYANKAVELGEPDFEPIPEAEQEQEGKLDMDTRAYELEAPHAGSTRGIQSIDQIIPPATSSPAATGGGLVQRMKALLETKNDSSPSPSAKERPTRKPSEQQLWRDRTFVELPATPIKSTNGADDVARGPVASTDIRITRDLVRATLSPSSSEHETILPEPSQSRRASQHDPIAEEVASLRRSSSEYSPDHDKAPLTPIGIHDNSAMDSCPTSLDDKKEPDEEDFVVRIDLTGPESAGEVIVPPQPETVHVQVVDPAMDEEPNTDLVPEDLSHRSSCHISVLDESSSEACDSNSVITSTSPAQTAAATAVEVSRAPTTSFVPPLEMDEDVDINAGVTSDIVTDIAVRFSIPRQTSMPKASIIRVSSVPEHSPKLHKDIHELPETISPRESVYRDMDTIAPLQVNRPDKTDKNDKHFVNKDDVVNSDDATNLSSFIRRSFPRRHSTLLRDKIKDQSGNKENEDPGAEQSHLSDLEEASQEDIPGAESQLCTTRLPTTFKQGESIDDAARLRSELTLSEIRNLPSLNFSQMNLIDQLNAALDHRDSRSIELVRKRMSSKIISPSPMRPSSTEALRERYTSFFAKPEDFHVPTPADESENLSVSILTPACQDDHQRRLLQEKVQQGTTSSEQPRPPNGRESRPLSPTELLGVASEANRISVPSVDGLSYRLSELLPSLKRLHLDSTIADDQKVKQTIDKIHHLGERPTTMLSARSSGVLRSLAAIADDIVTNGTHSSQYVPPSPRYNKSLPPLPKKSEDTTGPARCEVDADDISETSQSSDYSDATVKAPLRRTQSEDHSISGTVSLFAPPGISTTRRSLTISNVNSRPWNFDENYPWSSDTGPVDINLDVGFNATPDRESIASHILRAKATGGSISALDLSLSRVGENDLEETHSSPADVSELEPTATVTADTLTGNRHQRVLSKKAASLLGSLSRRAKMTSALRPSMDSIAYARPGTGMSGALSPNLDGGSARTKDVGTVKSNTTVRSTKSDKKKQKPPVALSDKSTVSSDRLHTDLNASVPLANQEGLARAESRSHGPHAVSDRYPYSALTPPIGYDLDEVRSYFSDDAESTRTGQRGRSRAGTRGEVLRKRLSGLRFGRATPRPGSGASWVKEGEVDGGTGDGDGKEELGEGTIGMREQKKAVGRAKTVTGVLRGPSRMGTGRLVSSLGNRAGAGSRLSYLSRSSGRGRGEGGYEVATGVGTESGMGSPDWLGGEAGQRVAVQVMGKGRVEMGFKRLGEKVRGLLGRGGQLLRKVSGRRAREKRRREREEWMEGGSMYSGT
ncbi:hypothetical protein CAC42_1068 [Sphaceloma murrayae]|uniref:Uncharacterized protein n=1 Tax=Sphaceloma murrayae TaxID=2082308 RepID=A0A2K1R1V6_9PEZI|nr:hypothetical protein CAC42_1068 [Sphaceloma murrayae]